MRFESRMGQNEKKLVLQFNFFNFFLLFFFGWFFGIAF